MYKPTLSVDFDGVIHSYDSGWQEVDFIPDPPVPGAFQFLLKAMDTFEVKVFSSRSETPEGRRAMRNWMKYWAKRELPVIEEANKVINSLVMNEAAWPTSKPNAMITLDDRAINFDGNWPDIGEMLKFQPWNKKDKS